MSDDGESIIRDMPSTKTEATRLCLYPEYGVEFPITLDGVYCGKDEVGFSTQLQELLETWNEIFLNFFSWDRGWSSTARRDEYLSLTPTVIEGVRREVPEGFSFSVHIFAAPEFEENFPTVWNGPNRGGWRIVPNHPDG